MKINAAVVVIAFALLPCRAFAAGPDYNDPAMIKSFAEWLAAEKEYARAASEYYRYFFLAPENEKDAVLYAIAGCFESAGDWEKAAEVYERILAAYPQGRLFQDSYYRYAWCLYKEGEHEASAERISLYLKTNAQARRPFLLLAGANYIQLGLWSPAHEAIAKYLEAPESERKDAADRLAAFVVRAGGVPEKSPVLAALLSAIIPGTGKIYAERWQDGLVSLALIAAFGGMAAYGFVTDGMGSVPGWLYAGAGFLFYAGDIWGSIVAASDFNSHRLETLKEEADELVNQILP